MSNFVFVQARMSSSRLPGKVLKKCVGKALLGHQLDRIARADRVDSTVVVTSSDPSDDAIEVFCRELGVSYFRGSLFDVLGRFWGALQDYPANNVIRLTADCPLIDPEVIDAVVGQHIVQKNDYTCNFLYPGVPDGMDVEVVTARALEEAARSADQMSEREHVTPYLRRADKHFKLGHNDLISGQENQRWTVDYPQDFDLVEKILEHLYHSKPQFGYRDILELLARKPELYQLNRGFIHNEGLIRSQANDKTVRIGNDGQISGID